MVFFFFILIIPLTLCATFRVLHRPALAINYFWAQGFFKLSLIPVRKIWHFKPQKGHKYILCANHFSYLDAPALGLFPYPFKFVGKSQLAKIPIFGFMYRKIHITVNRTSFRSRGKTLAKARKALNNGFNLGFFPEGGIRLKEYPKMTDFRDGAFRLAVESNTPIVPVTFPNNYNILTDNAIMEMKRSTCIVIYHKPIFPSGSAEAAIKKLKEEVFRVIQSELNRHPTHQKKTDFEIPEKQPRRQ